MCKCEDYAQILRKGEIQRDASDKIRGFLYQDFIAIDLILSSIDGDKIYVEWVEDIYIENANTISIFQVKHQPQSSVDFPKVFKDLFYQFLRVKLLVHGKEVKTYCVYHSSTTYDVSMCRAGINIKRENNIKQINKDEIQKELDQCKNMDERNNLIFDNVGSSMMLNNFVLEIEKKDRINDFRESVKEKLYSTLKIYGNHENTFQMSDDNIKEIFLAVAVQYIQKSYDIKNEVPEKRYMTKKLLLEDIWRVIGTDEEKCIERIKFIVISYIDEVISDLIGGIEVTSIAIKYADLYKSTKNYFIEILKTKKQRFKLLNTVSTDKYNKLNVDIYNNIKIEDEIKIFLEHKNSIKMVITTIWKILFNIDCVNFSEYISENNDCFFFHFPGEKGNPVLILSSLSGQSKLSATNALSRTKIMENKPKKWYMGGKLKGVFDYSFNVNSILEAKSNSIVYLAENLFYIECMDCIKIDEYEMDTKDLDIENRLFNFYCIKEA